MSLYLTLGTLECFFCESERVFMYNLCIKRYLNYELIQYFSEPILSADTEKEDKRFCDRETGEIFPANSHVWYNVFEHELDWYRNMGDPEENLKRSFRRTKNSILDIARSNNWDYFFTFTFSSDKVDRYNYSECSSKMSNWLKRMRRESDDLKYIVVPEQHKDGAWHFHGLFANCDLLGVVPSGVIDKKTGREIFNVGKYRFGYTTATEIESVDKACSYISKYITKDLCCVTHGKKRYWSSKNCDRPIEERILSDLSFREIRELFEECGDFYKSCNAYNDVYYLEVPIYTTNTNFSKRYRQIQHFHIQSNYRIQKGTIYYGKRHSNLLRTILY